MYDTYHVRTLGPSELDLINVLDLVPCDLLFNSPLCLISGNYLINREDAAIIW